jgi:hypothetical protein
MHTCAHATGERGRTCRDAPERDAGAQPLQEDALVAQELAGVNEHELRQVRAALRTAARHQTTDARLR